MNQTEINEAEWQDPKNWHGGWLGLYHSPRDSRAWVPKRGMGSGFTVNFANRTGVFSFVLLMSIGLIVTLLTIAVVKLAR